MDHSNSDILQDPGGEAGLTADWSHSESLGLEKQQKRCSSCMVAEDLTTNECWSQSSISRSLQRAESLLRNTFNPSLKWLFHGRCPEEEEEEEGNFIVAHNLMSRSSARLLRLQQALVTVMPQWQPVCRPHSGSPQLCVKGVSAEGGVLLLLPSSSSSSSSSSSFLQGHYTALWRLLEQRSLLLFIHEYTRRVRLAAAYVSKVNRLLEEQLEKSHPTLSQTPSWVGLSSLSQELRVHVHHWSCLSSRVQSDPFLRPNAVQRSRMMVNIKQTLDSLGLQALLVMERYVRVTLAAVGQTLDSVPRDVLEDVLAGTDVYNQAVGEQRAQHSATQRRTAALQRAHHFPESKHPTAVSVNQLMMILALRHADTAARQLHRWASEQDHHTCPVHSRDSETLRPEWNVPLSSVNHQSSSHHSCCKTPPAPDSHSKVESSIFENRPAKPKLASTRDQTHKSQTGQTKTSVETSSQPNVERQKSLENIVHVSTLSGVCQHNHSSIELLFQVLVSFNELLTPLVPHTPRPETPRNVTSPNGKADLMGLNSPVVDPLERRPDLNQDRGVGGGSDPEEESGGARRSRAESGCLCGPGSVRWLDVGQSLFAQYRSVLWTLCCRALWLQLHAPAAPNTAGSINLQDTHRSLHILTAISQAAETDLVPVECRVLLDDFCLCLLVVTAQAQWDYVYRETKVVQDLSLEGHLLDDFCLYLLVVTAQAQWDYELCRSLGSSLKDKCLRVVNQGSDSPKPDVTMSVTMEHFLSSLPLLSSLYCRRANSGGSGSFPLSTSTLSLQRHAVSLALATVQLSTVWVMSKAFQFLSSWSLNKFLLITQGDLKVLRESLELLVHQTKTLTMNSESQHHSAVQKHNQILLRRQLEELSRAVTSLQAFSSLMLETFSCDCKRMSGEIFEQTMPSAVHWRPGFTAGFPSSPSEYASAAAQAVIGQVIEGVAPMSDDVRIQALSITMTAFMEAWMEHILKQRIKFSVQGALQLKQDFDSIRDLIQSDGSGLSAEVHQQLLNLRVFQQVDSAVLCLLQQPQSKPYLQTRAWDPLGRCCPVNSSRDSMDAAVGTSITNLNGVEGEDLTRSDTGPVNQTHPGEPYLAPSLALGAAQREWLDLRISSSARRWRLPGLHCLSKSEP